MWVCRVRLMINALINLYLYEKSPFKMKGLFYVKK